MPTSSNEAAWQRKLAALRAHVAEHGRLPPRGDALGLGGWVCDQRRTKKAMDAGQQRKGSTMTPARVAALETVPGWAWELDLQALWEEKLAALRAHVAAHGRLPSKSDRGLGGWVGSQRAAKKAADAGKARTNKMTPERTAALEAVPGWTWELDLEALWTEKLAALRAYVGTHGRLPPYGDTAGLGEWISSQRAAKKAADAGKASGKKMTPARVAVLEAVPAWAWSADVEALWEEKLAALRAYVAAHGALPPPKRDPLHLGRWANTQRESKRAMDAGKGAKARYGMTPERAAALEGVPGWSWEPRAALWPERLEELEAYVAAHARLPPNSHPSGLGAWVTGQRQAKRAADAGRKSKIKMTPERAAALEAVPGWTWGASRKRAAAEARLRGARSSARLADRTV